MVFLNDLTEEEKEEINERMKELGEFKEGDIVTVEPQDNDINFAGSELIGVPLRISGVWWNSNSIDYEENVRRGQHFDEEKVVGDYYIRKIQYSFEMAHSGERPTVSHISEFGLISWEEYDGSVHLQERRDGKYTRVDHENDPCPICESTTRIISGHDMKVVHVGSESCGVCGYTFDHWD